MHSGEKGCPMWAREGMLQRKEENSVARWWNCVQLFSRAGPGEAGVVKIGSFFFFLAESAFSTATETGKLC